MERLIEFTVAVYQIQLKYCECKIRFSSYANNLTACISNVIDYYYISL